MSRIKRLKPSLTQFPDIAPPSMWLLALEHRAFWEFWVGVASFKPLQLVVPQGRPDGESINLRGNSHIGMGSSPSALYLIADRLAQPENAWQPFEPEGLARLFYGTDDHCPASRTH